MDKSLSLRLATQLVPDEKIPSKDLNITPEALKLVDKNSDSKVSRDELQKALEKDLVSFSEKSKTIESVKGSIPEANKISFFSGNNESKDKKAESIQSEMTYKSEQWFKEVSNPNVGDPNNQYQGISAYSTLSGGKKSELRGLVGKTFDDAVKTATTPYDVAYLAGNVIQYDYDRADKDQGPGGTYSPQETISSGTGVCRDTHQFAAAVLRANGYNAKNLGYSSADSVFHAFTVYQDPKTGKWGAIEYGKVYPPEMLNADTPEEAFMKVRPDALVINQYSVSDNPDERGHETGVYYTPTVREYNSFTFGKHSGNAGLETTTTSAQVSGKTENWEYALRYNHQNTMAPVLSNSVMGGVWYNISNTGIKVGIGGGYLPEMFNNSVGPNTTVKLPTAIAFGTVEGNHPGLVKVENVASTGINLSLNSKFAGVGTLAFNKSGDTKDANGNVTKENQKLGLDLGVSSGLTRFNWTPDITINREFDTWGDNKKDLNLYAKYGTDFDTNVMGVFYRSGGFGLPITQYAQAGAEAKINNDGDIKVGASVYVPIETRSNDFSKEPLVNVSFSTPNFSFSTTHGKNTHIYTAGAGVDITKGTVDTRIEAFASLEQDGFNKTVTPKAGAKIDFKF